jgi:hypothetical protein
MAPSAQLNDDNGVRTNISFWEQAEARFLSIADISCVFLSVVGLCFTGWSHFGGWALYHMVPPALFWTVSFINILGGPASVALSYTWTRQKEWSTGFKVAITFFFSTLLTAIAGCALLLVTAFRSGQLEQSQLGQAILSEFLMAVSVCFAVSLLLRTDVPERIWTTMKGASGTQPKLSVCDDLEVAAPGTCAICLEKLSDLEPLFAQKPRKGMGMSGKGLLRLPCGHTYHGICAENWFTREETCPLCRHQRCDLKRCTRICVKPGSAQEVQTKDDDANDANLWEL